jgi:tetratricopeptide (TPR) repeat protein
MNMFAQSQPIAGKSSSPTDQPLWKKILLSFLVVAMLFGLLEGILFLAGVDPVLVEDDPFMGFAGNVPLFVKSGDGSGEDVFVTAPNKRLFNHQEFPATKGKDTYRIFCLGGSTTFGRPYDDTSSFAGWLREILPLAAPDIQWEVINAGGVSYASYRVAHLMEELVRYEPDMFIVYTGQNEFLEERTYRKLKATPAFIRSLSGLLAHTRTWALMSSAIGGLTGSSGTGNTDKAEMSEEADTLLEHFGPEVYKRDDTLTWQVQEHFLLSLDRMARIAESGESRMVLVKPASNIKDCSPFKSQHTDGLALGDIARVEDAIASAGAAREAGDPEQALALLDVALEADPRSADLHYRRGKTLIELGRGAEARTALIRALEEDVCPLRIKPGMVEGIGIVAAERGLPLVDFDTLIDTRAMEEIGIPIAGQEYFLDHVHPTIRANGLLAMDLARTVLAEIGRSPDLLMETHFTAAEAAIAARLDPAKRARSLANLAAVLAWAGKIEDAVRPAHQALELDDDSLTVTTAAGILATWYATSGDLAKEKFYYRMALNANPGNHDTHWRIGLRALDRQPAEVELACAHFLYAAVFWQGEHRDAPHRVLGEIMASRGQPSAGFSHLLEAMNIDAGNPENKVAIDQVGRRLGSAAATLDAPKFTVEKYPSGNIRNIVQVRVAPDGRAIPEGIWTEWHEGGEPSLYREMAGGQSRGVELRWDPEGLEIMRTVH